ncbi:MAG: hypothetical protein ACREN7_00190 [Candidatus Dormibacteria bacterium]
MADLDSTSSILVPSSQADIALLKVLKDSLVSNLNTAVRNVLGPDQPLIVRDLTAQDIFPNATGGLFTSRMSNPVAMTAQTLTTLIQTPMSNQQAFGLYGYAPLSASPLIDVIQFGNGTAVTYARFVVDNIFADTLETVGYFNGPVYWTPNQTFTMQAIANSAVGSGDETFALYGLVVEPAGLNIQPVASA